ncbi:hypothetical protein [Pseudoduganella armeniaca]|uniref:Transmembrane protein n=1 Tax=Pseudoduganella armeniaca TaxID=2072590 RepID=A0A2R4CEF6_9BURK|nr:hypothetical protein [Pseudoduganella armeniaca]AVR98019.1 hypothetical protein C9I28_22040 [Pseudoduganella armeniaca]
MKSLAARLLTALALGAMLVGARAAAAVEDPFDFVVIGHTFSGESGDDDLKRTIARADKAKPAFVVAAGIKSASEACSDKLYQQRKALLNKSDRPLMLVLAAGDWTDCRNSAGRSNALERLNRIRELYFDSRDSLGERKLELNRQSTITKFRSYAENAYWERGSVLFATINLPANNNHYLSEAGRNSEYEDRFVANRAWLQRLFGMAKRRKLDGLVLFSDGDLRAHVEQGFSLLAGFSAKQDGFADTRKLVRTLAEKYPGKVLLIDTARPVLEAAGAKGAEPAGTLSWHGNLGHVTLTGEWNAVRVEPGSASLFTLVPDSHASPAGKPDARKAEKAEKAEKGEKAAKAERAP